MNALVIAAALLLPAAAAAQDSTVVRHSSGTTSYRARLALGFAASIAAHETAHFVASYAVGAHPSVGFDKGRPTIYSGIIESEQPHKQLIFSAAGLTTQLVLDELLLDIPHHDAGPIERGLLAGGIATAFFYISLGRNGAVSDVEHITRDSRLSKDQVTLIIGGTALLQTIRVVRGRRYRRFFRG
jgi:hypothetical protein